MFHELSRINFVEQKIPPEVEAGIAQLFESHRNAMVTAAISASAKAEHWDKERDIPMHVGCSMLILENGFDLSEPKMVTGANTKKSAGMLAYPDRVCAEMAAKKNALTEREDFNIEDKKLEEEKFEEIQEGDLKNQGFIAAIVTTSPSKNTGEIDTKSHDVVYPCKQCQENYKLLLQKDRVSRKTIIYSVRVDKDKAVAYQQSELGELLDTLDSENKLKEEHSLTELKDLFEQQIKIFLAEISRIDINLEAVRAAVINKHGTGQEVIKYFERLDQERVLEANAIFEKMNFRSTMGSAIKAVTEEGIPKDKALSILLPPEPINKLGLQIKYPSISNTELESILDALSVHLLYVSRHPEKFSQK